VNVIFYEIPSERVAEIVEIIEEPKRVAEKPKGVYVLTDLI